MRKKVLPLIDTWWILHIDLGRKHVRWVQGDWREEIRWTIGNCSPPLLAIAISWQQRKSFLRMQNDPLSICRQSLEEKWVLNVARDREHPWDVITEQKQRRGYRKDKQYKWANLSHSSQLSLLYPFFSSPVTGCLCSLWFLFKEN